MRIVIGNLPDDVTEEGIKEALKPSRRWTT